MQLPSGSLETFSWAILSSKYNILHRFQFFKPTPTESSERPITNIFRISYPAAPLLFGNVDLGVNLAKEETQIGSCTKICYTSEA